MDLCMNAVPTEARKELDLLELKLKAFVSHPTWVLRTELRSSGRAAQALTH